MNERGPDRSSRRFGHESNRRGGRAPANRRTAAARPRPNEAGRALHESLQHLVRLAEWAQYYLSASKDRLTLAVNESAWKSTFAVLAACVTFAGLVVCVVLTLNGVAGGLAGMFGGRAWLGELVTGVLGLALIRGRLELRHWLGRRSAHRKRVAEYEAKRQSQHANNRNGKAASAAASGRAVSSGAGTARANGHG